MQNTDREIITDEVKFLPGIIPIPRYSFHNQLIAAVNKILKLLDSTMTTPVLPPIKARDDLTDAFKTIQKVIQTSQKDLIISTRPTNDVMVPKPLAQNVHPGPRWREMIKTIDKHKMAPTIAIPKPPPMPTVWPQVNDANSRYDVCRNDSQHINHIFNG